MVKQKLIGELIKLGIWIHIFLIYQPSKFEAVVTNIWGAHEKHWGPENKIWGICARGRYDFGAK